MKKNFFKKMMYVFVLLFFFLSVTFAQRGKQLPVFYYSNTGAKSLETVQTVCIADKKGKYLTPHLKYYFTYDSENRVIKKEAFRWNPHNRKWVCHFHLRFSYPGDILTVEYARWNPGSSEYYPYTEKAVYRIEDNRFSAYRFYTKEEGNDNWQLVTNMDKIPSEMLWLGDNPYMAKNP